MADSAATATAFFCGVKANFYTVGLNGKVSKGDCQRSLNKKNRATSILQWAQDAGKDTGMYKYALNKVKWKCNLKFLVYFKVLSITYKILHHCSLLLTSCPPLLFLNNPVFFAHLPLYPFSSSVGDRASSVIAPKL